MTDFTKEVRIKIGIKAKEQVENRYREYIRKWKAGSESGLRGSSAISNHVRKYLFEKYHHRCSKCGWNQINIFTNKIPLELNHIDGNYLNMKECNLELLCPNCHALTENFKSRNKNHSRPRNYVKLGALAESAKCNCLESSQV
jgi:rubredoxin